MNINNYKSGVYKQQYKYKSFSPQKINIKWEISDLELIGLLSNADIKLGELNAFSQLIPDIDFFIKMHVSKEATQSSKIEGTRTNIKEVLQKQETLNPEKRDDWQEVHNYISAMNFSIKELKKLPVSTRLIKKTHKILLSGSRGKNKQPGEYRKSQNWIGGASINDAVFVPPHHEEINELISDLEKFLNNDRDNLPYLIKAGISHYQFETIHPFLDGNGRIGRLLITLYLIDNGLLIKPCLYLSDYFEKNRNLYYDNLTRARTHNDLKQWLIFFLEGIYQTSQSAIDTFKKIIELRENVEKKKIATLGKRIKIALLLMNHLYSKPLIEPMEAAEVLKVNISTANRLIDELVKLSILEEITGFKRNRIFIFKEYLDLFG
ncbi:MAG: Fic family protein [bacterium]